MRHECVCVCAKGVLFYRHAHALDCVLWLAAADLLLPPNVHVGIWKAIAALVEVDTASRRVVEWPLAKGARSECVPCTACDGRRVRFKLLAKRRIVRMRERGHRASEPRITRCGPTSGVGRRRPCLRIVRSPVKLAWRMAGATVAHRRFRGRVGRPSVIGSPHPGCALGLDGLDFREAI